MIGAIQEFWNETPLDNLLSMSKDDVAMYFTSLADEYSNNLIKITIDKEQIHFENVDERAESR